MERTLRILHLEDDPIDTEMVSGVLRQAGLNFQIHRVYTFAAFQEALASGQYALVLSDFAMPGVDPMEALRVTRRTRPEVPFVFVSGTLGEEEAVETLKSGAADYVLKQRMGRLVPAIRRALQEAEEHLRRRQAEEALRASEERFRSLFEDDLTGDFLASPDGRILLCNPAYVRIFGFSSREEAIGSNLTSLHLRPEGFAEFIQLIKDRKALYRYECDRRRRDGAVLHIVENVMGKFDDRGELIEFKGYVFDDTERRRAEELLRRSERRLRIFFESDMVGTIFWHMDGRITDANDKFLRMIGYRREELLAGRLNWSHMTPPEHRALDEQAVTLLKVTGVDVPYEKEFLRKDGSRIPIIIGAAMLDDAREEGVAFVLDITDRKQTEEALEKAKAAAEEANAAKSQFVANMNHELRTPMSAILGMTEQALEEDLSPSVRDCLETVQGAAETLLALLNELLDYARIEAGKMTLECCRFGLRETVEETLKILSVRAEEKALALRAEFADEVPDDLVGDPTRLRQVLTNLVGNAIKFTERGGVTVRVVIEPAPELRSPSSVPRSPSATVLRFEVADTGIGIPRDKLEHIFEPFTQADASTSRRFGGTGLGLTITTSLVHLMGGEMGVESEPGKGSTFRFTVRFGLPSGPLADPCAEQTRRPEDLKPLTRPLHVLLAEDTPANQKLIVRILRKRGHAVEVAGNGHEALELFNRRHFDVVLMDVSMPVMDGLEATAAIRALGEPAKARVPIIAMTAHAMKGDEERLLAAGMDAYLAKPVGSKELIRTVESLLE